MKIRRLQMRMKPIQKYNRKKMNKIQTSIFSILTIGAFAWQSTTAQIVALRTVEDYLDASLDNLPLCFEELEKAEKHEKTMNHPRLWLNKARVYSKYFENKKSEVLAQTKIENAGLISLMSMVNYYKVDPSLRTGSWTEMETNAQASSFIAGFNECGEKLNLTKNYDTACLYYENLISLFGNLKKENLDLLSNNSITLATLKEKHIQYMVRQSDPEKKLAGLKQLVEAKSDLPVVYSEYVRILLQRKTHFDTMDAGNIVKQAVENHPNSKDIFNVAMSYYIQTNQMDVLYKEVDAKIAIAPDGRLYYTRGYLRASHMKDELGAEADYRKAIELDNILYDAYWNLGVLVYSKARNKFYENNKKNKAEFETASKEAKSYFETALDNTEYSAKEKLEICKNLRNIAIELENKNDETMYEERIKTYEALIKQ